MYIQEWNKYMYVCLSVSLQDRLEYMKCFHSCMCMRHSFGSLLGVIEKDDAYVSWLGAKCSPTRYIHRADALRNAQRNTDKWKHSRIHKNSEISKSNICGDCKANER